MATSPNPSATGLSLPSISAQERARQCANSQAGSVASTSTLQAPAHEDRGRTGAPGAAAVAGGAPVRLARKRRAGRGRMMMVKVFYSLSSPTYNPVPASSTPATTPPFALTPAFLAALDPSLLPDPPAEPAPPSQHQSYTCLARLSAPVWVQLLGSNNSVDATKTEYGKLTLKTCLSAICISRPELVTDPTKDYAVSAVDPYESSLQPSPASSAGQGLMEGKGMLSWNLAEKREGTTWVCGRVVVDENAGSKRRKVEEEDDGDGEGSEDEEEGSDTLEVWLQLVERPSFTQTQFLTSLRSFANSNPMDSSDRASSPPRRRQPFPSSIGDPVKKKRPRDSDTRRHPLARPSSPRPLPPLPDGLAGLQDPQVLALLSQMLPLGDSSEQSRAALPAAIRTLATFFNIPEGGASAEEKGKGKEEMRKTFVPIPKEESTSGNTNPRCPTDGCSNCKRKKAASWRESTDPNDSTTVCNACGVFYNKNGYHRSKAERTSPAASRTTTTAIPSSSTVRPLQGRLTATCESDLKKAKKRRTNPIPPPSPSKHIGPNRSPSSIFRLQQSPRRAPGFVMTSPDCSPRLRSRNAFGSMLGAATSPVRGSMFGDVEAGLGIGLRSGYESDEGARTTFDFSALYGGGSPSPQRRQRDVVPDYLLTASPGTALKRILNDTSIDLGSFDMPMEELEGARAEADFEQDFNLYLRSTPEEKEKENEKPSSPSIGMDLLAPSTDFESVISDLRRDFSTSLSSNALTAPSSPPASSPCVQPRTSSATPGSKSKAPASCGRPPPSILDSFMDGLVPAIALVRGEDGDTPSDGWPASPHEGEDGMLLDSTMTDDGDGNTYDLSHLLRPSRAGGRSCLPSHFLNTAPTSDADFDFGSLPPSSPPALPSEAGPTPSEFGSAITPDEEGYLESGDDMTITYRGPSERQAVEEGAGQEAVAQLLQSLGIPMKGGEGEGGKVQLDRSTVAQLLQMLAANSKVGEMGEGERGEEVGGGESSEMDRLYESLLSGGEFGEGI